MMMFQIRHVLLLALVLLVPSDLHLVEASTGWSPRLGHVSTAIHPMQTTASVQVAPLLPVAPKQHDSVILRGGQQTTTTAAGRGGRTGFESTVAIVVETVTTTCQIVLPVAVALIRTVVAFYRTLPVDLLLAQAGLASAFLGGYYPTLFAAVQAAQHCGLPTMLRAVDDLTCEALIAVEAASQKTYRQAQNARQVFLQKTGVVMAAVDPVKINQAAGALFTSWMGISAVLERQFARTITLSVTIAEYLQPVTRMIVERPVYLCVPEKYHRWVPVVVGWMCKAVAMSVAWRIQRVLSATSSAVSGGLMFARACLRMLSRRGITLLGVVQEDDEKTPVDEVLGLLVAAAGLRFQLQSGFSFRVPFPLSLFTWPFDWAERWIQWQITKKAKQ